MPEQYFFDSSAIIKHYRQEIGTDRIDRMLTEVGATYLISRLTQVEVQSAFAKLVRIGALTDADFRRLTYRFLTDLRMRLLIVIDLSDQDILRAARLIRRWALSQNLRTLDSLQLAAALALQQRNEISRFVSADVDLCSAASREGLSVINPEVP
jgi:predicted nucleic acid-binding protein